MIVYLCECTAANPFTNVWRTLRAGFSCVLSGWETASIQTVEDYQVTFPVLFIIYCCFRTDQLEDF